MTDAEGAEALAKLHALGRYWFGDRWDRPRSDSPAREVVATGPQTNEGQAPRCACGTYDVVICRRGGCRKQRTT